MNTPLGLPKLSLMLNQEKKKLSQKNLFRWMKTMSLYRKLRKSSLSFET